MVVPSIPRVARPNVPQVVKPIFSQAVRSKFLQAVTSEAPQAAKSELQKKLPEIARNPGRVHLPLPAQPDQLVSASSSSSSRYPYDSVAVLATEEKKKILHI